MSETRANQHVLEDGLSALSYAVNAIDDLFKMCPVAEPEKGYMTSDATLPGLLVSLSTMMGVAWASLFDTKARDTRPFIRRAASARADALAAVLDGIDVAPLRPHAVRNAMVHVDEYMLAMGRRHPNASWIMNLALSRRELIQPGDGQQIIYCRVFISDERRLLHLGHEIDLAAYRATGAAVLERTGLSLGPDKTPEG